MLLSRKRISSAFIFFLMTCTSGLMADEFSQGEEYIKQGRFNKANWIYLSSLENNERVDEAHLGLAKSMKRAKKYESALQYINKYLEVNTNSREALQIRSQLFILLQQWKNAVADIKRLMPSEDNPGMYMLLNIAYENLDQRDLAKQAKAEYYRLEAGSQPK